MKKVCLVLSLIVSVIRSVPAATSIWIGNVNQDYFTTQNWSPFGVPYDEARFELSSRTNVAIGIYPNVSTTLNQFYFASNAPTYQFTLNTSVVFRNGGILNDSANVQRFNSTSGFELYQNSTIRGPVEITLKGVNGGGGISFSDSSSAGNADIVASDSARITFFNSSRAGTARLTNYTPVGAGISFLSNASADHATITNYGWLYFKGNSTAADATITTKDGGLTTFIEAASSANAAIIVEGSGVVNLFSSSNATLGSLAGNGRLVVGDKPLTVGSNNQNSTFTGVIEGTNLSLTKVGNGVLNLASVNNYSGGIRVEGGTLQGAPVNFTSDIVNNANVQFNHETDGTITRGISGVGTLEKKGSGTLTLAGPMTYTGRTLVSGGTLQGNTNTVRGSIQNDARVVFDQTTAGVYTGVMSGSGSLVKRGTGLLTLSAANTYTGDTTIETGGLHVLGSVAGRTLVQNGTQLTGTGSAGAIVNRGMVTPGLESPGTMRAASYTGAGTLQILFDQTGASKLQVFGNANVTGGTLKLNGARFTPGTYSVLTSGSFTDKFQTIEASPFLEYVADYAGPDLNIIVKSHSYASVGKTANERALGRALDRVSPLGRGSAASITSGGLSDAMLLQLNGMTSAAQASAAMAQMSGDALVSFQDQSLRLARSFSNQLMERTVPTDSASAKTLAPRPQPQDAVQRGLWSRAIGSFDRTDAEASIGAPSSKASTFGFQAGVDREWAEDTVGGVAIGYARSDLTVDERNASGDSNGVSLSLYGSYSPRAWIFRGLLGYGRDSHSMSRGIDFAGARADSDFSANVVTAQMEVAYGFEPWRDTAIEPTLTFQIRHLSQGSFTETGAPGLNLAVDGQSVTSVLPELGVRLSRLFKAESRHPFMLAARLGIADELGSLNRELNVSFADDPASAFVVQGTPQKRIQLSAGLNARVVLKESLQLYADYALRKASQHSNHELMSGVRWLW